MLLKSLELLAVKWGPLFKNTGKLTELCQTLKEELHIHVSVLKQRQSVTAPVVSKSCDPLLDPYSVLARLEYIPVDSLDPLRSFYELYVQHRVSCVEVSVLLAKQCDSGYLIALLVGVVGVISIIGGRSN